MRTLILACLVVSAPAATAAAADVEDGPVVELAPTEIEVAPQAVTVPSTGTATVVQPADKVGTAASLADLVASAPGVQVRHLGLPGSLASVAIRGLGGQNVSVVLDDVPLASATLGAIDLSLLPVSALERVEVYRGTGPVRFDTPLGGVVRLVSRPLPDHLETSAHLAYGSFESREAHAEIAGPVGSYRLSLLGAYQGTAGDFPYYDDRATPYNSADDRTATRANNASNAVFVRASGSHDGPAGSTLKLTVDGLTRDQGIPGPNSVPVLTASAAERELLGRLSLVEAELADGAVHVSVGLDGVLARRDFHDPLKETGLSFGSETSTLGRLGADTRLEWLWLATQETELDVRTSWDQYVNDGKVYLGERRRVEVGLGAEHRADFGSVRLVPSVRADLVRDAGNDSSASEQQTVVSPRMGLLWSFELPAAAWLSTLPCELRANGGRFHRLPTTLERFGQGPGTMANPSLRPERGLSADTGLRCEGRLPAGVHVQPELAVFVTRATDSITYVVTPSGWPIAENLGIQSIRGLEAALSVQWRWLRAEAAYTLSRGVDASGIPWNEGKMTPGLPRHRLDASVDVGSDAAGIRYELDYNSLFFLDPANTNPVPPRAMHAVAAHYELTPGLAVRASVSNLTDVRAVAVRLPGVSEPVPVTNVDFLGYPLPGRAFMLALVWRQP